MSRLLRTLLFALGLALAHSVQAERPPLLLANILSAENDCRAYLVSEKLDGVRAYWDGEKLVSRSGRQIAAPAWFTAEFPKRKLDGELWLGRGQFERISALVRREQANDSDWREVRYMLFELPDAPGDFVARQTEMRTLVAQANVAWLQQIPQFSVVDRKSLQSHLDAVLADGGEGLMLHRADAAYLAGRSDVLLKFKKWLDDEAVVVGHLPGKGRNAGRLGALLVRRGDGREFRLGSGFSDEQRRSPPQLGARITYRYRELSARGMPRFATFWRIQEDA